MINFYEFTIRGKTYEKPHDGQLAVLKSNARYKVVCCGRRWGKSVLAVNTLLEHALANSNSTYWYVGPCYDDQTEVLTQEGWKSFDKVTMKDKVAILDRGKMVFENPVNIHKYPYKGELVGYKDNYIDMAVTPNHRCYIQESVWERKNNWVFKEAQEIEGSDGEYLFRKSSRWTGEHFANPSWFELLGLWFADGYVRVRERNKGEVLITQKKRVEYVENLLDKNGFNYTAQARQEGGFNYVFGNSPMAREFVKYGKARTKAVPQYVKDATPELIMAFLIGYWKGDGTHKKDGSMHRATTYSQQLASDIQELAVKAGLSANVRTDRDHWVVTLLGKEHNKVKLYKKGWYKVPYNGFVRCVETRTGVVYVRRGGTSYWCGNTFRQAKTIAWRYLISRINMLPAAQRKKISVNGTNLSVEFPNGTLLELKGVERPDNLLGVGLDGVVLDEYATDAFGSYPIWKEIIRPSLSDRHGWAIFISTPRGYNHFYELFEFAQSGTEPGWESWRMPSKINPIMTESELEAARRELGADLYSQEYEAEFKKRSGLVYPEFNREIHILDSMNKVELSPRWELEVGVDFGGSHPTAGLFVLFSQHDDTAYIVDEHYESNLTTTKHAGAMKAIEDKWLQQLRKSRPRVRWGDSQAKQLIMDYNQMGYHITPTIKGKGSVNAGIEEVKKRLSVDLVTGKPKLYILKDCVNTIREFENYVWISGSDGSVEEDEMMRLAAKRKDAPRKIFDDAMDALRYVISHHVPIGSQGVRRINYYKPDPLTGI